MLKKILLPVLLFGLAPNNINSQTKENFEAINEVWSQFYQAFDSLDYTLMAKIHSKELVRVSGGNKIIDYDTYINNYKSGFENSKTKNETSNISLRFFERLNNDSMASERGIYKLVRNKNRSDERAFYGQFHVILKKEGGTWKIVMDYDSNPENRIGEKEFLESVGINEYQKFIKE